MKVVAALIAISTFVGLLSVAQPDQPVESKKDDAHIVGQQQPAEEDRLAHAQGTATANNVVNQPMMRPPSPAPLNMANCYACSDCPEILANTTSKVCPYTLDPTRQGKCVVYVEKYRHMKKPWYIRGCTSERGSCAEIRQAHSTHTDIVKLLNCYECEGDRCNTNSASLSLIDITMAFFAMVVTPVVAKYTLV